MTEQITTPEALDALPVGSVVLDRSTEAWQKDVEGLWCSAFYQPVTGSTLLDRNLGPLTILWRPDAPAPVDAEQRARELWPVRAGYPDDKYREDVFLDLREAYVRGASDALTAPVDSETAEVIAERARAVALGYSEQHDDEQGAYALAVDAQHYVARALAQGNRTDLVKAAGLLLNAAASFRRLGQPLGSGEVSRG